VCKPDVVAGRAQRNGKLTRRTVTGDAAQVDGLYPESRTGVVYHKPILVAEGATEEQFEKDLEAHPSCFPRPLVTSDRPADEYSR